MKYTPRFFDPLGSGGRISDDGASVAFHAGNNAEEIYVYQPRTILAVNVALATGRPLLVAGEPGCGKSTLARNIAAVLGWSHYKQMITSRVQAKDLLWTFDALKRLNDANLSGETLKDDQYYIKPGRLWWANNPETAANRGRMDIPDPRDRASDPGIAPPEIDGRTTHDKAVILLDEIDKADPDVPNDLLEPLDLKKFTVDETGDEIKPARDVLVILTTNGERELPPAFMRRCVAVTLDAPTKEWFISVAESKFGSDPLHDAIAVEVMKHRRAARKLGLREPSTGEYLDAIDACRKLQLTPDSDAWQTVAMSVLWKHEKEPDLTSETGD